MAGVGSNLKAHQYEPSQTSEVGSETRSATTIEYRRHPIYYPSEWLLESISSLMALGLLLGIAIIFWYMDNKPLSAWRGPISLNATISILTTACTAMLMHGVSTFIGQSKWLHFKNRPRKLADLETFDGASRGVWGSILLLTTIKWNLATIGAFITILRLAFSPFTQQVVLIEQHEIISPSDTAAFGYAHNYSRNVLSGLANAGFENVPQDPGMQSAIMQALYGVNTTEPFMCPGVCRWTGSYISLGFKATCKNVTQDTLQTATCENDEISLQRCNMTTPGGVGLATRALFTELATEYYMNASSLLPVSSSREFLDAFPEITRFGIYRSTPDFGFKQQNVNITECSLFLTAYKYMGAKANGSHFSFASRQEVDFGVKNPWAFRREESPMDMKLMHLYTNESTSGDTHIPSLEISYASLAAVENFFLSSSIVTEWVVGNFINADFGVAAALSGDVDLSNRFDRMATAMTDYLRYGPNTQSAQGEIYQTEPFVFIRWGYFVVPIITEGLAILFAISTIYNNRRSRRVPLWKSSTLAVLACQHEAGLGLLQTSSKDINEIQHEANKAEARL
ncbi:hypothetical protein CNMCM8812_005661 [Aspergillus fumigatus]|nr:hypothetical protein CNMCM8812_005661 [Aspergillus fumigatus]